MRLIDADMLDKAFTSLRFTADGELAHWGDRKDWCLHGSEIEMLIANAPTVEAEPIRHGERIYKEYKPTQGDVIGFYSFECSECGCASWIKEYNYCPYCGARMEGNT